jgi:hypothetical protein
MKLRKKPILTKSEWSEIWDIMQHIICIFPKDTQKARKIKKKIEKYLGFGC